MKVEIRDELAAGIQRWVGEGGFRSVEDFLERAAAEVLDGFDVDPGAASPLLEPERLEAVLRARGAIAEGGFQEMKPGWAGSLLERVRAER